MDPISNKKEFEDLTANLRDLAYSYIEKYNPSVILCAYSKKLVKGNAISETKKLLNESIRIAQKSRIPKNKIVVDPAIGFFRRSSDVKNKLPYTKITYDWAKRDIEIIETELILRDIDSIEKRKNKLIKTSRLSSKDSIKELNIHKVQPLQSAAVVLTNEEILISLEIFN